MKSIIPQILYWENIVGQANYRYMHNIFVFKKLLVIRDIFVLKRKRIYSPKEFFFPSIKFKFNKDVHNSLIGQVSHESLATHELFKLKI